MAFVIRRRCIIAVAAAAWASIVRRIQAYLLRWRPASSAATA